MKLTTKVSNLLGKKQRLEGVTFGQPLDLGQIAMNSEQVSWDTSSDMAEIVGAKDRQEHTKSTSENDKRTSILDLDFMAAPLAEIELVQEREIANKGEAAHQLPITKTAAGDAAIAELPHITDTMAILPAPLIMLRPLPSQPAEAPIELISTQQSSALENSVAFATAAPTNQTSSPLASAPAANLTETALAQSLRGDTDTGFMAFGPDGRVVESTFSFQQIIGVSDADIASLSDYNSLLAYMSKNADLGSENTNALNLKAAEKMREQLAKGVSKTDKWVTTMSSGKVLEFSNKYTPNRYLVSLVRDVTKQIEKDRLLRASLELGTAGYWSYSFTTGKSTLSDYITNNMSEAEIAQVEAKGIISIIHPDDALRVQAAFDIAVSSHAKMDCEFRLVLDGKNDVIMRMIGEVQLSTASQEPEVFIAFLNNLTEDRLRAKELNDVKELSRNKSEFLARMSHEIKTPLNAIVGMTDALRDEVDSEEARETASFIADAAENLNTILSQTLEHERLCTSEIVLEEDIVDLSEIVRSTTAMWKKPCADKGLKLDMRVSADLPKGLKIDSSRFRQCLTNLLSNAVKFTDKGGLVIAVAPLNLDSKHPKILVAVRDTGIGMSPEALKNIFKPFQQGDTSIQRRFGGSGLGMSITQHIVEAMGGHIKVKSVEGEGATIAITLPLRLANAVDAVAPLPVIAEPLTAKPVSQKNPASKIENLPAETFHSITAPDIKKNSKLETNGPVRKNVVIIPSDYSGFDVLVVEDNPINQAVVRKLLTNHIQSMNFAFHGEEALEILETKAFDVILMDIHMPVKDGIETTLEIRNSGKAWADTVIVALTADPDYQQRRICRNIGMNDALSKPVKRQDLLDALQKVLNERHANDITLPQALSA